MDVYDLKLMMKKTDMFGRPLPPKLWFFTDKSIKMALPMLNSHTATQREQ